MARFWRFKSGNFKGEFFYVDPSQIVGVSHQSKYDDDGNDCFVITLRGGDEYYVYDADDAQKLLRWAESESEAIPDVPPLNGGWK